MVRKIYSTEFGDDIIIKHLNKHFNKLQFWYLYVKFELV